MEPSPIFDRLSLLADPTRSRLLLLLEEQELTVSELCSVIQAPQSTVSRHLKMLADESWVGSRREGTSRLYRATFGGLPATARRLWALLREELASLPAAEEDARRLGSVLAARRSKSQEFFASTAGRWNELRQEMFGAQAELLPVLALLDGTWAVGDLGCGTGNVSAALAPFVARVVAVDDSPAMLEAARARLASFDNVEVRRGRLEALPLEDDGLDVAVLALVLHHLPEPGKALAEAARVVKPGGRLLIVDMTSHDREEYRQEMGHVWLGFSAEQLREWAAAAGFGALELRPVPADPEAKGPSLFAATARRVGRPVREPETTPRPVTAAVG